jgi:hypothetical protein
MCKSFSYSLISKNLFTLKYFASKSNFNFNYRLLIYDSLSRIAVIHEELFITNHQSFTFFNITRQATRLQVRFKHLFFYFLCDLKFVLVCFVVVCLPRPYWCYSDIANIFGQICVYFDFCLRNDSTEKRTSIPDEEFITICSFKSVILMSKLICPAL